MICWPPGSCERTAVTGPEVLGWVGIIWMLRTGGKLGTMRGETRVIRTRLPRGGARGLSRTPQAKKYLVNAAKRDLVGFARNRDSPAVS